MVDAEIGRGMNRQIQREKDIMSDRCRCTERLQWMSQGESGRDRCKDRERRVMDKQRDREKLGEIDENVETGMDKYIDREKLGEMKRWRETGMDKYIDRSWE